jgi:methyl-accepting chemotaxis protein
VVADEVGKLAEQSQKAADDIVQMTGQVTSRVAASAKAMEASAGRVGEIERVSRDIDAALRVITDAAERTRVAAVGVTGAAEANSFAVISATSGLESIAKTAEQHAAAAEQVNASTQEQSAACEQMTSASNVLLAGSTQLRELVGGLRT